jgi:K+-sensing histidine kinase KdpD
MAQYIIVAFKEEEPDRHYRIEGDNCIIGRTPDSDLVLPDFSISRRHATINVVDGIVLITDEDSTNGVYVNGEKITKSVLSEGDFVSLGCYTIVMRVLSEAGEEMTLHGKTMCLHSEAAMKLHEDALVTHNRQFYPVLYRTGLLLEERSPLEELLQHVLQLIVDTLPCHRGAIVIQPGDQMEPEILVHFTRDDESGDPVVSRTLLNYVLRSKTALLTDNAQTDPRFRSSDTVLQHRIGAAMCAPMCGARQAVGVIYVDTRSETSSFAAPDLEFLTAVGHVVGMAVENKLLDKKMMHQEQLAAVGQAISGISHDVRSVLTGAVAGVDLLELAYEKKNEEKIANAYQIIRKSTGQIEAYLSDLLLFVKTTEISRCPTYLNGTINDIIEVTQPTARKKNVKLHVEMPEKVIVHVDGPLIQRVLLNLITNSIEACDKESSSVHVSMERVEDDMYLRVKDTGVGISPENIKLLSEPFFSTKGSGNSGLGLAISFRIVEKHGGRISVTSEAGQGTTFTIFIPCAFFQKEMQTL